MRGMPTEPRDILWDSPRLSRPHEQADKAERVRRMFDQIAPTYELVNSVTSAGRDRHWRRKMVELARVRPDDVLLDIACGTGDVARNFASVGEGGMRPRQIVGLDFSLPMLEQAARRPIAAGDFCQGDALRLPVADASVSIVTCAFGIRNFQDLARGFAEMHRVLRPGGRAVLLEFSLPRRPAMRWVYLFYIRRILPLLGRLISRDRSGAYRYLPSSVVSFPDRDSIAARLREAGFSGVAVHPLTLGIVAVYVAERGGAASANS
jgi:demethylmenaquinone methyltransferase / 2-methoxy-6-polyprenyl-1,4-benzoquinol methylase